MRRTGHPMNPLTMSARQSDDPRLEAHRRGVPLTRPCEQCEGICDFVDARSDGVVVYRCRERTSHQVFVAPPKDAA